MARLVFRQQHATMPQVCLPALTMFTQDGFGDEAMPFRSISRVSGFHILKRLPSRIIPSLWPRCNFEESKAVKPKMVALADWIRSRKATETRMA